MRVVIRCFPFHLSCLPRILMIGYGAENFFCSHGFPPETFRNFLHDPLYLMGFCMLRNGRLMTLLASSPIALFRRAPDVKPSFRGEVVSKP